MKRKTLYNFNSVQLTLNQCVFNRIQYRTEHNLYSTRLDNVDRMKSSTRKVQLNTAWKMEIQHRLYTWDAVTSVNLNISMVRYLRRHLVCTSVRQIVYMNKNGGL